MKGITYELRKLPEGEWMFVEGMERSDIHKIATRVGIKIRCEKKSGGFLVTRKPSDKVKD